MPCKAKYMLMNSILVAWKKVAQEGQKGKKSLVVLGFEIINTKNMGRAYAKVVESATSEEILSFMHAHVDKKSKMVTDKWASYISIKKSYPLLEQKKSAGGKRV